MFYAGLQNYPNQLLRICAAAACVAAGGGIFENQL